MILLLMVAAVTFVDDPILVLGPALADRLLAGWWQSAGTGASPSRRSFRAVLVLMPGLGHRLARRGHILAERPVVRQTA